MIGMVLVRITYGDSDTSKNCNSHIRIGVGLRNKIIIVRIMVTAIAKNSKPLWRQRSP